MNSNETPFAEELPLHPATPASYVLDPMLGLLTPSFSVHPIYRSIMLVAAVLVSYMAYLYLRLSRKKSARPFKEIPTLPSVQ